MKTYTNLYNKIMHLHPSLTSADFDHFTGTIELRNDGQGDYIARWEHATIKKPTHAQLSAVPDDVALPRTSETVQAEINAKRQELEKCEIDCNAYKRAPNFDPQNPAYVKCNSQADTLAGELVVLLAELATLQGAKS